MRDLELLEALHAESARLQTLHKMAVDHGRRDIADLIRSAEIDIVDAIALSNPYRKVVAEVAQ